MSSSDDIEQMYEPVEIAHLLKVDTRTVRMWLRDESHPLQGTKIGTLWRVTKSDLQKFLKEKA